MSGDDDNNAGNVPHGWEPLRILKGTSGSRWWCMEQPADWRVILVKASLVHWK